MKWQNFPKNSTKGKRRGRQSLSVELLANTYYVNGRTVFVHFDAAMEYAHRHIPTATGVYLYVRPGVVYMHTHKPSALYTRVTDEKVPPEKAWDLFVGHVGMLS